MVLIALLGVSAIESEVELERKNWGKGGKKSPFERFRNPQTDVSSTEVEDEEVEAEEEAETEAPEFTYENVMDSEEEACYLARYTDVPANMSANEHYARKGEK